MGGILATASTTANPFSGTASFGSDGEAGPSPNLFALVLGGADNSSGLDTIGGADILLFKEGDDIIGRAGSAAGAMVFKIEIDAATGTVIATQYSAIKHDDPSDHDEADDATDANASVIQAIASGKVAATRSITDNDDDTDSASVDLGPRISFQDDGPSDFTPAAILASDNVRNQAGQTATRDLTGSSPTTLAANFAGADGLGSLMWLDTNASDNFLYGTIDGTTGVLKSGGLDISVRHVDADRGDDRRHGVHTDPQRSDRQLHAQHGRADRQWRVEDLQHLRQRLVGHPLPVLGQ